MGDNKDNRDATDKLNGFKFQEWCMVDQILKSMVNNEDFIITSEDVEDYKKCKINEKFTLYSVKHYNRPETLGNKKDSFLKHLNSDYCKNNENTEYNFCMVTLEYSSEHKQIIKNKDYNRVYEILIDNNYEKYSSMRESIESLVKKTTIMEVDGGIPNIIKNCYIMMTTLIDNKIIIINGRVEDAERINELFVILVWFHLINYITTNTGPNKIKITIDTIFNIIRPYYNKTSEQIADILNTISPNIYEDIDTFINTDSNTINKEQFTNMVKLYNASLQYEVVENETMANFRSSIICVMCNQKNGIVPDKQQALKYSSTVNRQHNFEGILEYLTNN